MSTTITPGIGAGVLFTQQGVGADPGYAAIDDRRMASLGYQEGVYGASDFMVVQHSSGANMSVDVGMPSGGFACVQGDSVGGQGIYVIPVHATTITETVTAADPTNPRVDQVILEVLDNVHDASGSSLARVRVLTGTATTGTTLDTRVGAATLPGSALLLADVLVSAGATSVDNTKIRDRRKFARGYFNPATRATGVLLLTTSSFVLMDTAFKFRAECSGVPLVIEFAPTSLQNAANAAASLQMSPYVDGAAVLTTTADLWFHASNASADIESGARRMVYTPAAGSHLIELRYQVITDNFNLGGKSQFTVREEVRQATANNTVTSG